MRQVTGRPLITEWTTLAKWVTIALIFSAPITLFAQSLSEADIIERLRRRVPSGVIEDQVEKQGISFKMDTSVEQELRKNGSSEHLIVLLRRMPAPSPKESGQEVLPPKGSQPLPKVSTKSTEKEVTPARSLDTTTQNATGAAPKQHILAPKGQEHVDWTGLETKLSVRPPPGPVPESGYYAISFWVTGPPSLLKRVKRIEYYFDDESFHPKTKIGAQASNGFRISYKGWGCIDDVRVTIVPLEENVKGAESKAAFCGTDEWLNAWKKTQ